MNLRASSSATLVAALLLGLAACAGDGAPSGLSRTLDSAEPSPIVPILQSDNVVLGGTVDVLFRNTVDFEFWFNPCERHLERRVDGVWVSLGPEMRLCTSMAYILRPNGERTEPVDVPLYLVPGSYRFVFPMRMPATTDVAHWAASTSFEVR